jgi:hypothetical protein
MENPGDRKLADLFKTVLGEIEETFLFQFSILEGGVIKVFIECKGLQ